MTDDPNRTRREFVGDAVRLGPAARPGGCEPLDWLGATAPRHWRFGDRETTYDWGEPFGTNPLRV
jgi:hypothetical protein